jgi:hypothetical protein
MMYGTPLCMKTFAKIVSAVRDSPALSTTHHAVAKTTPGEQKLTRLAVHHRLGEVPVGEASIGESRTAETILANVFIHSGV